MSEFDKLKDEAEQYAKDHPEQVQKAEQGAEHAVEDKLGIGGQDQDAQQDQGSQQDQGAQQDQAANDSGQDSAQQDQNQ